MIKFGGLLNFDDIQELCVF